MKTKGKTEYPIHDKLAKC